MDALYAPTKGFRRDSQRETANLTKSVAMTDAFEIMRKNERLLRSRPDLFELSTNGGDLDE